MIIDAISKVTSELCDSLEESLIECLPEADRCRPIEVNAKRFQCMSYADSSRGETWLLDGRPILWVGPMKFEREQCGVHLVYTMKREVRRL